MKEKEKKSNDLFATIDSICLKKPIDYDKKEASGYMLTLWLSHEPELMPYVDEINAVLFGTPDKLIYKYFFEKVPKKKRFIKWIKKSNDKVKDDALEVLCDKYNISKREAMMSL